MDPARNTVTLGRQEALLTGELRLSRMMWQGDLPQGAEAVTVKLRLGPKEHPAVVFPAEDGGALLRFDPPVFRAAAGQSAVLYRGDFVVGAGFVEG